MSTIDVILTLAFFGIGLVLTIVFSIYGYSYTKYYRNKCEEMKKWKF